MFSITQSKYLIVSDFSNLHPASPPLDSPKAGEIWQLQRMVRSPLTLSELDKQRLYSEPAQQFIAGASSPRYVMIVRSSEPDLLTEKPWQLISVMVLSPETDFLSDIDVLIPSTISGIKQDLLAETWHVLPMLVCNLRQPIGQRLSRAIYDTLMSVGDANEGLIETAPLQEVRSLGLAIAPPLTHQRADIQAYHQQEKAWSDVLSVPVATYHTYLDALRRVDVGIAKALYIEQELQALTVTPLLQRVSLMNWLRHQFEPGWVAINSLAQARLLRLDPIPLRASVESNDGTSETEITALIKQVSSAPDAIEQRRAAKQLGTIAKGHEAAIQALLEVLRSTTDDETLWTAVESLWQIDPGNAISTRRVKLIDLGLQVSGKTVALAIALVRKSDQRMGVMLRVYPTGDEPYLPPDLKLILIDDANQSYEVTARHKDLYIQRKFSADAGEGFRVRVALEEANVTESFVL
ncbi:MAG: DUF1822 family protein [Myxacorys chilensis ATA2-1-KO14]|jgi:hypothetical protein|nr:DUF1822 family protein [Myxacorys chilensis ATA2-1-KO14]